MIKKIINRYIYLNHFEVFTNMLRTKIFELITTFGFKKNYNINILTINNFSNTLSY